MGALSHLRVLDLSRVLAGPGAGEHAGEVEDFDSMERGGVIHLSFQVRLGALPRPPGGPLRSCPPALRASP